MGADGRIFCSSTAPEVTGIEKIVDVLFSIRDNSTLLTLQVVIKKYLYDFPFIEKKRIMEAVINPANGGKVLLRYGTKQEDREGETVLDMEFDLDIDRNESLINSLNKKDLLNKGGYNGISCCNKGEKKYS